MNFYLSLDEENIKSKIEGIKPFKTQSVRNINIVDKKHIIKSTKVEELKNKILLSLSKYKNNKNKEEDEEKGNKEKICEEYKSLIWNINHLLKILNSLKKAGYPHIENFRIEIKDSKARDKNNNMLEKIVENYNNKFKEFKNLIKNSYEKYPLLRLFYGPQFIQLYEKAKYNKGDIYNLLNSVTLNKIKETEINFLYGKELDEFSNINNYLKKYLSKMKSI